MFPDSLKIAKVIPVFKQGSQLLPNIIIIQSLYSLLLVKSWTNVFIIN